MNELTHDVVVVAGVEDALSSLGGQLIGLVTLALQVVGVAADLGSRLGNAGLLAERKS